MIQVPPITRALLILNGAVFLLQQWLPELLLSHFALWPLGGPVAAQTTNGITMLEFQPWQLLTYGFMHGNFTHLLFNMFALWMFGSSIEALWGAKPFLYYYLITVLFAGVAQLLTLGEAQSAADFFPTVGASGGVFGVLLAFGMMFPHRKLMLIFPPIPMPAWLLVTLYGAFELYMGVTQTKSGIAHFAHLGGMAAGFVIIQYWRGKLPIKPKRILMM